MHGYEYCLIPLNTLLTKLLCKSTNPSLYTLLLALRTQHQIQ